MNVTRRPLFRRENEGVMLVRCAAAECWRAGGAGRGREVQVAGLCT